MQIIMLYTDLVKVSGLATYSVTTKMKAFALVIAFGAVSFANTVHG